MFNFLNDLDPHLIPHLIHSKVPLLFMLTTKVQPSDHDTIARHKNDPDRY